MKTTWLHSMVQGDATQYYRKRNGIMVEHMVRPANFDMRYNHLNQEYEIYLLLRGRRQMFFENRAYEAQAGNLILWTAARFICPIPSWETRKPNTSE